MQIPDPAVAAGGGPISATSVLPPAAPANAATGGPDNTTTTNINNNNNNTTPLDVGSDLFEAPVYADGRYIRDARGRRFKLASVNWYGGSDELFIPSGLDKQSLPALAALIRSMGFNSVRLPYSDEMVMTNPLVDPALLSANPALVGKRALDVYTACVTALTDAGLAVIVNNHITAARWCDGKSLCDAAWKNDHLKVPLTGYWPCRVKLTEDQWIANWVTVMRPLVGNGRVIGCDLRNEVRGVWGTMTWDMWATAAERCGDRLLDLDSRWLMFVEGISSANDCSGARTRPVRLKVPGRLVYSVHVYAWSGWGSADPFSGRQYPSFALAMHRNWGFLVTGDVAPVWVGEMGSGPAPPGKGDANYWANLCRFLTEFDVDFAYWAINPRKPKDYEKETWTLTDDNWTQIIRDYRLDEMTKLMKPLGYQQTAEERVASGQQVPE